MRRERVAGDESGFTLVEMLVVVVIEAMIVTALGSAFVLVWFESPIAVLPSAITPITVP